MANTTLTASIVAKASLAILENELTMASAVYRGYEDEFDKKVNGYEVGDTITITARDDFGVAKVNVDITDLNTGESIESGWAVPAGSGRWRYAATKAAAPGINAVVQVTAVDYPGGTGTLSSTRTI